MCALENIGRAKTGLSILGFCAEITRPHNWLAAIVSRHRNIKASAQTRNGLHISVTNPRVRELVMDRHDYRTTVEAEARTVLGEDHASGWMSRPSRLLDGMAPAELATSRDGARAVLHELRRASDVLRASRRKRKHS